MRDRCSLVIYLCICPITCWFSKYSKTWFWYITVILKNEKVKEPDRERTTGSFMKTDPKHYGFLK
jgi:hypothetical protein